MSNIDMREYCFTQNKIKAIKETVKHFLCAQHALYRNDLCYAVSGNEKELTFSITGEKRFSTLLLVEDILREYGLFFCKQNKGNKNVVPFTDFDWVDSDGVSSITIIF